MIRTTLITAAVAMALGATGSAWAAGYKAGTYQASAQGMGGPVKVEVEFTSSAIKAVRIVGTTKETPGIGTTALEKLPPLIVENKALALTPSRAPANLLRQFSRLWLTVSVKPAEIPRH